MTTPTTPKTPSAPSTSSRYDVIVVGLDDSPHADLVLEAAIDHARGRADACVHLVRVIDEVLMPAPTGPMSTDGEVERLRGEALGALDAAAARVRAEAGAQAFALTPAGSARETLLTEAERLGAKLLVIGTHGRTGLSHLLLGSVAEKIVRYARCPVLVVPRAGA